MILRPEVLPKTIQYYFAISAAGASHYLPHKGHETAREYAKVCGQYYYFTKEYEWGVLVRERKYEKLEGVWIVTEEFLHEQGVDMK